MSSGSGRYHGFSGFKEFSNQRSIIYQSKINFLSVISPPYTSTIKKIVEFLGGKGGGGRSDLAQGGAPFSKKFDELKSFILSLV